MLEIILYKNNKGYKIYLNKVIIGKVLFEIKKGCFCINFIQINAKYRNKGHANSVIKQLLKLPYKCFITTNIAKSNIASINLFKKNGFNIIENNRQYYAKKTL